MSRAFKRFDIPTLPLDTETMDARNTTTASDADSEPDLTTQRLEALVHIAKRSTLTPLEARLFKVANSNTFAHIAKRCIKKIGLTRERFAIENALHGVLDSDKRSLGERRDKFQKEFGISLSTTIRLERLGAEQFVRAWSEDEVETARFFENEEHEDQAVVDPPADYIVGELRDVIDRLRYELRMKEEALDAIREALARLDIKTSPEDS